MMYCVLHFKVFKEGENDIRYKKFGSLRLLAWKPYFEVYRLAITINKFMHTYPSALGCSLPVHLVGGHV